MHILYNWNITMKYGLIFWCNIKVVSGWVEASFRK